MKRNSTFLKGFVTFNAIMLGMFYSNNAFAAGPRFRKIRVTSDPTFIDGYFSGIRNAVNTSNEATKASIRTRLSQLSETSKETAISNKKVSSGKNAGEENVKYGIWVQGLNNYVKRDKTASNSDFRGHSKGLVIGMDAEVADNFVAGLAYSYTKSKMKTKDDTNMLSNTKRALNLKTDIDTHGFFAYGQYKPNELFINGSLGYGFSKAEMNESVSSGSNKDIKSKFYSADVLAGYEINSNIGILLPAFGLRYVRFEQKTYREKNSNSRGEASSKIELKDTNTLTAVAQFGWNDTYKVENIKIKPKALLGFIYDLKSDNNKLTVSSKSTYLDAKMMSEDGRLKRFGTELSAGVDVVITNNWNVSLDYVGELRQHYENHTGTLSLKYDF